jgi:hypothetical protein
MKHATIIGFLIRKVQIHPEIRQRAPSKLQNGTEDSTILKETRDYGLQEPPILY